MVRRLLTSLTLLLVTLASVAQANMRPTQTAIFDPAFKTLQAQSFGGEAGVPVLVAGSDDRLTVSFDELATDRRYMRYELIHCNAFWQPDRLIAPEFVYGFNEGTIDDYAFSEATTVHYIHYWLTLPNEQMHIKLSGNYLLRIYDENNPDQTLLQVRFCVVKPEVRLSARVSSRTDVDYNRSHQQLELEVNTEGAPIRDRYNDIIITVEQNGRQDNRAAVFHPTRIAGNSLIYEHCPEFIFEAGNEYRRMEIVSTTYPGMGVESNIWVDPLYHATLWPDYQRASLSYTYDRTQHGRFTVREYDATDSDTQADYVMTHFALECEELPGYDIFIDGDMTQRTFGPESRMVWNHGTGRYEGNMLLKQGAYNYQYLAVPSGRGSMRGETGPVEGDKYQTTNEYVIKIYHRDPMARYDRLIGSGTVVSGV